MEFIWEGYKLYSLGCEALSIAKVHTERNNCSEVEHQEYIGGKKWKFIAHDQQTMSTNHSLNPKEETAMWNALEVDRAARSQKGPVGKFSIVTVDSVTLIRPGVFRVYYTESTDPNSKRWPPTSRTRSFECML